MSLFKKKKKNSPIVIKSGNWDTYRENQIATNEPILYTGELFLDVLNKVLYIGAGDCILSFKGIPTIAIDSKGRLSKNNLIRRPYGL